MTRVTYTTQVIYSIVSVVSLVANSLVAALALKRQRKDTSIDLRIADSILALDISFVIYEIVHIIKDFANGDEDLMETASWCIASHVFNAVILPLSLGFVTILALLRLLAIVYSIKLSNLIWYSVMVMYTIIQCSIGISALYFSYIAPSPSGTWCRIYQHNQDGSYNTFALWFRIYFTFKNIIQAIILSFSYMAILRCYNRNIAYFHQNGNSFSDAYNKGLRVQQIQISVKMAVILSMYLVSVLVGVFCHLAEVILDSDSVSPIMDATANILENLLMLVNPIFLLFLHEPTSTTITHLLQIFTQKLKLTKFTSSTTVVPLNP